MVTSAVAAPIIGSTVSARADKGGRWKGRSGTNPTRPAKVWPSHASQPAAGAVSSVSASEATTETLSMTVKACAAWRRVPGPGVAREVLPAGDQEAEEHHAGEGRNLGTMPIGRHRRHGDQDDRHLPRPAFALAESVRQDQLRPGGAHRERQRAAVEQGAVRRTSEPVAHPWAEDLQHREDRVDTHGPGQDRGRTPSRRRRPADARLGANGDGGAQGVLRDRECEATIMTLAGARVVQSERRQCPDPSPQPTRPRRSLP